MLKYIFLGVFLGLLGNAAAQEYKRPELNLELFVQELVAQQEDDNIAYEDIYENLFLYYQNPINLNTTTAAELSSLFLLSPTQIQALFTYQQQNGKLVSIYELQAVPGFDLLTISKIIPFVTVQEPGLISDSRNLGQRLLQQENQYIIARFERTLQTRKGFTPADSIGKRLATRYTGSPDKILMRYRNSHAQDYSVGFTLEKDTGEQFVWQPGSHRYGFDFYSAHFQVYNKGKIKALALGDYQLQFGQGLITSAGFAIGKGSETITTVRRSNIGIRPFSSALETNFFRGLAATYLLRSDIELTGFYSGKKIDASLQNALDTLDVLGDSFSGIQTSGFHRTATEISNKHRVGEQVLGGNITYRKQNFTGGLTLLNTFYAVPLNRTNYPYNIFDFNGDRNLVMGFNYSYNWQNISFFGETARSSSGGLGTVNGLVASLARNIDLSLVYRNYAKDFHSFYANAFGESTRNSNESGFYMGLKVKPAAKWEVTGYYDRFRFPWLRYRVDAPSFGDEYLIRILYKPTKTTTLYAQFRSETKALNFTSPERKMPEVLPTNRRNYITYLDYAPTEWLTLRSRVQFSQFSHNTPQTTGYYIGQEIIAGYRKTSLSLRYALFDTDDYDTRQYVTERDVLYAFSVPAFSGTGSRVYVVWQQGLTKKVDFWLKFANTFYRNQKTIGSGLEEINGLQRTDLRVQVRYKF